MAYPDLPKNRLILIQDSKTEIDLTEQYRLILADGYSLGSPVANTKTLTVLGSSTILDLTETLLGDTSYKERKQILTLFVLYPYDVYALRTEVYNLLHGKRYKYRFTMDPDYYYRGRFNIDSCALSKELVTFSITITADPFKYKPTRVYKINAFNGVTHVFQSGRMSVRPTIESESVCYVKSDGKEYTIPAGTHQLTKICFKEGNNELYINSKRVLVAKWADVAETGVTPTRWSDMVEPKKKRWDEFHTLGEGDMVPKSWGDHTTTKWGVLSQFGETPTEWNAMNQGGSSETNITLTYEWGDL